MIRNTFLFKNPLLLCLLAVSLALFCLSSCSPRFGKYSPTTTPASGETDALKAREKKVLGLHKGIDVSHFSGSVDWEKVKSAGYTFAFAKASEGMDYQDPKFASHWEDMKKAGLIRGAYHFYETADEPEAQAEFFISVVKLEKGDLAPVLDIETITRGDKPPMDLVKKIKTFLEKIEKHYGIKPIIYTAPTFWDHHLDDHFGGYPLWIAEYDVKKPVDPDGWKDWHFWQWKGDATVPGVEKTADLSVFNKKEKDLPSLLLK